TLAHVGVIARAREQHSGRLEGTEVRPGSAGSGPDYLCSQCPPWRKMGVELGRAVTVNSTRSNISTSEIRRQAELGESLRYLVPDPVIEIIFREQLYR